MSFVKKQSRTLSRRGAFGGSSLILLMSVLRQNYEVALLVPFHRDLRVSLPEAGAL